MKRKYVLMGAVVAAAMIAGAEAVAAATATGKPLVSEGISLELGRRDFNNYCAACHGVDAKGDGSLAEFLTLTVPDITKLSKLNAGQFPAERVREVIDGRADVKVHGMRDMPVWGDWFNAEAIAPDMDKEARELVVQDRIQSLINYIDSVQTK